MRWDDLAVHLGYVNSSKLRHVREGESLLTVDKLASLATVTRDGRAVSVDLLLTGVGSPLRDLTTGVEAALGAAGRSPR